MRATALIDEAIACLSPLPDSDAKTALLRRRPIRGRPANVGLSPLRAVSSQPAQTVTTRCAVEALRHGGTRGFPAARSPCLSASVVLSGSVADALCDGAIAASRPDCPYTVTATALAFFVRLRIAASFSRKASVSWRTCFTKLLSSTRPITASISPWLRKVIWRKWLS